MKHKSGKRSWKELYESNYTLKFYFLIKLSKEFL